MKPSRLVLTGLAVLAVLLILPPTGVAARQLLFATTSESGRSKAIQAAELYDAWQHYESFVGPPGGSSHTTVFPYLDCDHEIAGNGTSEYWQLTTVFIVDAQRRQDGAYGELIERNVGALAISLLTGCLEASPFASMCAEKVRAVTYGNNDKLDSILTGKSSDAAKAKIFCRGVPAMLSEQTK